MKLSVVLISYNEKEYLAEALESCLNQQCGFPFEIIIGDDGSDDGSLDVIRHYQKRYPDVISYFVMDRPETGEIIPSLRVSNVVKRGMAMARGEYLTLLSGDDYYCDLNKFARQVSFLDGHPEYVACWTGYKKIREDGREIPYDVPAYVGSQTFWGLKYLHISCFVFRRSVREELLNRFCDDTGLLYSILSSGKSTLSTTPPPCGLQVSFVYRQRPKSIMSEADPIELDILELMLFQDTSNHGKLMAGSLARFARPLRRLFRQRARLSEAKYRKYAENCAQYPNNYFDRFSRYDKLPISGKLALHGLIATAYCCRVFLKACAKGATVLRQRPSPNGKRNTP